MKAMVIEKICDLSKEDKPLSLVELPIPKIESNEILVEVAACGVCHTELDEIEGRTAPPKLPVIPGHQIVGRVVEKGGGVTKFNIGDRVGIGWIYAACGSCEFCKNGLENLCNDFKATGRDMHGGYAEYFKINENFAVKIPDFFNDYEAAPLLCAGAIGYRSLKLAGIKNGDRLGLTGFGASAHLVLKLVKFIYPNCDVYVFARNPSEREFALSLGAVWAGDITDVSPEKLHAIIDTTPVWKPIVEGMKNLLPAGKMIINAIRKEDLDKGYLLNFKYEEHIWMEKVIKSVANVTLKDIEEFIEVAAKAGIKPEYQLYELTEANIALKELKNKKIRGAKVLKIR
ncbi:zinc-dependent alcohol dehydrogenase family protein [Deferribacter thermophilus]|uniref:zinc-dependent alcohol dehydrogenase family protein n=1 Tax=Deferribacter thermophilus TaxID=53573 RepID=UPI003C1911C0